MKFYNSAGPNPRMVKMFMAEKGIDLPREVLAKIYAGNAARLLGIPILPATSTAPPAPVAAPPTPAH